MVGARGKEADHKTLYYCGLLCGNAATAPRNHTHLVSRACVSIGGLSLPLEIILITQNVYKGTQRAFSAQIIPHGRIVMVFQNDPCVKWQLRANYNEMLWNEISIQVGAMTETSS